MSNTMGKTKKAHQKCILCTQLYTYKYAHVCEGMRQRRKGGIKINQICAPCAISESINENKRILEKKRNRGSECVCVFVQLELRVKIGVGF